MCLARFQLEVQAKSRQVQLQLQLEIKKLQTEPDKVMQPCQLELEPERKTHVPSSGVDATGMSPFPTTSHHNNVDISKHIVSVPTFRESEVDSYVAFESIASALYWPIDVRPLLLQCKGYW